MRIALVHPTGSNWMPGKKDITSTANRMAPLGLLSLAAYLEQRGHQVMVYDCLGPRAAADNRIHVDKILAFRPELVGISATTSGFLDGYALAGRIKQLDPQTGIVFGGVHVSAMGTDLLKHFAYIDYLCMGEGEATLAELADGGDPAGITGLIYRQNGSVRINGPREHIADLDSLPFPAYEKLAGFPQRYNLPLFSYIHRPGATMVTSRGCQFQCTYCDRSVFKRGFRYNSADYIFEHMRYLRRRFNVRHINIYDDLFTANRRRIVALCERLAARSLGVQFNCAVRVGHADDQLLQMLRDAGCLQVSLGIETGDTDLLQAHKPGVELEEVKDTVRRIQAAGLRAKGLFMMGLPGETEESIRRTSDFALSLGLDDMNMSKFTPFPGAPIWATVNREGVLDDDWRKMNCLNFVYVPKDIHSRKTLDRHYNRHVKRFYTDPGWRRKFRRRWWQHRWSIWHMAKHIPTFLTARRSFEDEDA